MTFLHFLRNDDPKLSLRQILLVWQRDLPMELNYEVNLRDKVRPKVTVEKRLRWSRGSVLAFGTQVRGFTPGRSEKILSTPSFGGEVKPSVPCRSFTACKRSLNVTYNVGIEEKLPDMSRPQFHLPPLGALAW